MTKPKTFDQLMADARDCEILAINYITDENNDLDDPALVFQLGHHAAMDRMEPALREAVRCLEQINRDADDSENGMQICNNTFGSINVIRALLEQK